MIKPKTILFPIDIPRGWSTTYFETVRQNRERGMQIEHAELAAYLGTMSAAGVLRKVHDCPFAYGRKMT